jgi:hypothetical protein
MPWTPADAEQHIAGLTAHQRVVWARVANSVRAACIDEGRAPDVCDAAALRQAAAVARQAPTRTVKVAEGGALDILAVPFGGPFADKGGAGSDFDGQRFSDRTDLCLSWFPQHRPLLWHHGLEEGDDRPGVEPIGTVDVATAAKDSAGWWVRAQLDASSKYWRHIMRLLDADALYASSGAMSHLVKIADDGEILRWPWVELSLTPTPSNLFAIVQPAEAKAHYKSAGLDLADTREAAPASDAIDIIETVGLRYADAIERLLLDVGSAEPIERLLLDVSGFMGRTKSLADLRLKEGRAISSPRRQRLAALLDAFRNGAADLEALLAETEPRARGIVEAVAEVVAVAEAKTAPVDPVRAGLRDQFATYAAWRAHYAALTPTAMNGDD